MQTDSSFAIKNNIEIIRKLTFIWKQGCLITASFGEPKNSFITSITQVDAKKQTFSIGHCPNKHINQQLLSASNVTFNTNVSGVEVQFSQQKTATTHAQGQTVLSLPAPELLYWLEHRQFYRIRLPLSNPATCRITITTTKGNQTQRREFKLNFYDLSISGVCLMHKPEDKIHGLNSDKILANCHVVLPETGDFLVSIKICNQRPLNIHKPDKIQLTGAQLVNPTPAIEAKIQRYMQAIERENRKKI